jgi:RNA polymerase sigma-70 factor (ECF subfamily)
MRHEAGFTDTTADDHKAIELAEALAILKDDEREIVLLSVVAGLTSNEIAKHTLLQPGAVRSKLSRSLAKMREFLSQGESYER